MTDRNAHSWVEVWFAGYGWLPFDPTPGRVLHQRASTATPDAEQLATDLKTSGLTGAASAAAAKYVATVLPNGLPQGRDQVNRVGTALGPGGNGVFLGAAAPQHGRSFIRWLLVAVVIVLAALLLGKWAAVKLRYLRRGPRAQASAAFADIATFAGDQGVTVGSDATYEDLARRLQHVWGVEAFPFAAGCERRALRAAVRGGHRGTPAARPHAADEARDPAQPGTARSRLRCAQAARGGRPPSRA